MASLVGTKNSYKIIISYNVTMVTKQSHTCFVVDVVGNVLTIAPLSSGRGFDVGEGYIVWNGSLITTGWIPLEVVVVIFSNENTCLSFSEIAESGGATCAIRAVFCNKGEFSFQSHIIKI